ncbi:MAG: 50S ribosomal protein L10 [Nitrospinae bacterium]|nr:50S ribosomal protein L10 [Nitrospinota bacterium]TDJ61728.1 MAG: 50S ribosomal protein L10 [Nitrospina sp.]
MPTSAKQQTIDELNDVFTRAKSAILAHYHGISAADMTILRTHMRERAVDFRVIKNTLAKKAMKDTPLELLESEFKGPVSLLVSFDDAVAPAKALADYARSGVKKSPDVVAGVVEGQQVTLEEIQALADLPSKEVLLSQLLSVMNGPTTNFVGVFSALLRKLVGTLDAIKDQKAQG